MWLYLVALHGGTHEVSIPLLSDVRTLLQQWKHCRKCPHEFLHTFKTAYALDSVHVHIFSDILKYLIVLPSFCPPQMSKKIAGTESSTETKTKEQKSSAPEHESARRDFLKVSVAAGVGACAIGAPVCAAIRLVTAPVFAEASAGKFYPLATLASLTERPQKFALIDDKKDAWTTLPQQKIGTLFLRKIGDIVQAFHSLCPHAGCMLQVGVKKNPKTETDEELFFCPCHAAFFDLGGSRLDTVAPRDMDSLEVKIENGRVFVKFENFTFGIADKKAH